MKRLGNILIEKEAFEEILTGNEVIVRAARIRDKSGFILSRITDIRV
jgi:hypothetical protein